MSVEQILGLLTGICFGFLLQKARVLRYDKQVGAMLFRDMTIIKFMMSAILVGMVGVQLLESSGILVLNHKPMNVGGILLGGILFGAGWAVMGFCPGTSVGAVGEGRWHALFAVVGMVVGAAIYAELYPLLKSTVLAWKDYGKIGLPQVLNISPWFLILALGAGSVGMFLWFERRGL